MFAGTMGEDIVIFIQFRLYGGVDACSRESAVE